MKLNLGCGANKKPGFINIDGNEMVEPDRVIDLGTESLLRHFSEWSTEAVLAQDIIEHLFHWQAVQLLKDVYAILGDGGTFELRLPDFEAIINHPVLSPTEKIDALFGGQDRPRGETDIKQRRKYPEFYCHKFAYTKGTIMEELKVIGFTVLSSEVVGTNMIINCRKEKP